jgi:stage III sporulation protein AH
MIINIKKFAVAVLVVAVLIGGTALVWSGNRTEASRTTKEDSQQNDVIKAQLNKEKQESFTSSISFFAEYRMERERTRGKQVELLREIINNQASEAKAREAASLRIVQISQNMENEMKAENLVKSKGFKECVVIIQQDNTMVVVQSDHLDSEQGHEVAKLVSNASGTDEDRINVILRK